jgi:hypothetical protein
MVRCVFAAGRRVARCCLKRLFLVVWLPRYASTDILDFQTMLDRKDPSMQTETMHTSNLTVSLDLNAWTVCPSQFYPFERI